MAPDAAGAGEGTLDRWIARAGAGGAADEAVAVTGGTAAPGGRIGIGSDARENGDLGVRKGVFPAGGASILEK